MKTTIGTFIEMGGANLAESLSASGLDYVIVDTEHGHFNEESVTDIIRVCEKDNILPYVRIGDTRRPYILRMLDIGARGLIVPYIKTMDQIRDLVSYGKFRPIGDRGFCPTRTTSWGARNMDDKLEFMQECNRRTKLIPQCETKEALEIIEEIAATDGIDGIFVGPFDLSISLGIPLQFDNPILIDAIRRVLRACKENGKESVIFAGDMEKARFWKSEGFDSITYSLDASVLTAAYRNIVNDIMK